MLKSKFLSPLCRDPGWEIQNLGDVALEARRGMHLIKTRQIPANNLSMIYNKAPTIDASCRLSPRTSGGLDLAEGVESVGR